MQRPVESVASAGRRSREATWGWAVGPADEGTFGPRAALGLDRRWHDEPAGAHRARTVLAGAGRTGRPEFPRLDVRALPLPDRSGSEGDYPQARQSSRARTLRGPHLPATLAARTGPSTQDWGVSRWDDCPRHAERQQMCLKYPRDCDRHLNASRGIFYSQELRPRLRRALIDQADAAGPRSHAVQGPHLSLSWSGPRDDRPQRSGPSPLDAHFPRLDADSKRRGAVGVVRPRQPGKPGRGLAPCPGQAVEGIRPAARKTWRDEEQRLYLIAGPAAEHET
jgi:hypothetical protein